MIYSQFLAYSKIFENLGIISESDLTFEMLNKQILEVLIPLFRKKVLFLKWSSES